MREGVAYGDLPFQGTGARYFAVSLNPLFKFWSSIENPHMFKPCTSYDTALISDGYTVGIIL